MRLKLTVDGLKGERDVLVTADSSATVGDIAQALARSVPEVTGIEGEGLTIRPSGVQTGIAADPTSLLDPNLPIGESALRSGARVAVAKGEALYDSAGHRRGKVVATLRVHGGPARGQEFPLMAGSTTVGRDSGSGVVLRDPFVSQRHVRISVTDTIEVVDLGSANGTSINGHKVQRSVVRPSDRIEIGDSVISITPDAQLTGEGGTAIAFNRPPWVLKAFAGGEVETPDPPSPTRPVRFPVVALVAPLIMAFVLAPVYLWVLPAGQSPVSIVPLILMMALSPLLMLGSYFDQRKQARVEERAELQQFNETVDDLWNDLLQRREQERASRLAESPSTADGIAAAESLAPLMWYRRTDRPGFLEVRLGVGRAFSRTTVKLPDKHRTAPRFWNVLKKFQSEFATIDDVPIVGPLAEAGGVGVSGPHEAMTSVARALVAQVACLHSPAELVIMAVGDADDVDGWSWLKWLPHVGSAHSPVKDVPLANSGSAAGGLIAQLEELIAERKTDHGGRRTDEEPALPRVLLVVLNDAPVERSRLVGLAEDGPEVGIHVLWCAGRADQIPASCRAFVDLESDGSATAGLVHVDESVSPIRCESLSLDVATHLARRMAPVIDAGARIEDESDLPRNVAFLASLGTELARSSGAIVDRWQANDPALAGVARQRREPISLRAVVGQGTGDAFALDLRAQGPHALVGGTTGAGKSEFLQTWVLSLAASQSPNRINFLFVDYKGGSAFARCTELPHSVGIVTDLDQHLVRRALTSLRAELTYREHILNHYKVKDIVELEKRDDAQQLPSLIIIVDEFAALAQEMPEFVDGVIDVAQRGRSLGLHLILATQRPAGVIKGNLRANTNLRVALRMADAEDSEDVVGETLSAGFDPAIPGRAAAKTGPGRISVFQSLYAGGSTPDVAPRPEVDVHSFEFGAPELLRPEGSEIPTSAPASATDLDRVVDQVISASRSLELPEPRRPWLPVLAPIYDWEQIPQRTDTALVIGMQDLPHRQANEYVHFRPDVDGNMAVIGTGGSGKSTVLRTLAISAGATMRGGPCDVYGLDFGSRGLAMLEELPHVGAVISGTDHERVGRLLRWLRDEVDRRSQAFVAAKASNITEYRASADKPDERRILVLLDGFATFRQEYELARAGYYNLFGQLAADGRGVGIHFVVTADRPAAIPASLGANIQQRLTLRLSDANDYGLIGVPADVISADSPPGRGLLDGLEVQVAVLGGSASLPKQADAIGAFGRFLVRQGRSPAQPIDRLSERIRLSDLPSTTPAGLPVVGVADDTLAPFGLEPSGAFLIVGPPASGRTTTAAGILSSLARREVNAYLFSGPRSSLSNLIRWSGTATTDEDAMGLAMELEAQISSGQIRSTPDQPLVLVMEGIDGLSGGVAEGALETLAKTAVAHDAFVLGESEVTSIAQSYLLGGWFKQARRGIALQPDDVDGLTVFRTTLPRASRSEFPPGRGVVVDAGATTRVQMCLPE